MPSSSQISSFRDSAIDVDESRPSADIPKDVHAAQEVMPAPSIPFSRRSVSPMPPSTGRRSSLNLHSPALQGLKRVTSHLQLPSSKRNSAQESILSNTESFDSASTLRKRASAKDLAKQQRLYKKVSNLESKLEAARRELEEAQGFAHEPALALPTSRKTFTPGALPSLPSERMLKDHVDTPTATAEAPVEDQLPGASLRSKFSADPAVEAQHTRGETRGRKRKSIISGPLFPNLGHRPLYSIDPAPAYQDDLKRPRKAPTPTNTPRPLPRVQSEHDMHQPKSNGSRKRTIDTAPPVPALPPPFTPSKVDRIKIMTMRSSADYAKIPFGQDPADAANLRKVYPTITDAQLDEVLGRPVSNPKTTDFTSTTHAPATRHSRSASPKKNSFKPSISKSSLRSRGRAPVPIKTPASMRKTTQQEFEEISRKAVERSMSEEEQGGEEEDRVPPMSGRVEEKGLPPYPKDPSVTVASPAKPQLREKELPRVQREEYQWDEDVF